MNDRPRHFPDSFRVGFDSGGSALWLLYHSLRYVYAYRASSKVVPGHRIPR
jgi:hypothetical protein